MIKSVLYIKLIFSSLLMLSLMAGCKKDSDKEKDPESLLPKAKLSLTGGDKQSGIYGEKLANELSFKITPIEGIKPEQYYLEFAFVQGNGMINGYTIPQSNVQQDGTAKAIWQLGCNSNAQKIKVYLYAYPTTYTNNGKASVPQDSIEVQATGTKPIGWGKSCGCGVPDMFTAQVTTFDSKTLYLASNKLYSSTDGGMNWYEVAGVPKGSSIVGAQFNTKGWLYVLTKTDGIFYSKDLKNWQAINNGILDKRDPTGFMVKDDTLMVSFYFDGPYITTDNGLFWQKMLVSNSSQRFGFFNKHADGSLYLFDDWGKLFRSKDTGKTWQPILLDYGYYLSQPTGFSIGTDGNLYVGADDAVIAQVSPTTLKGTAKRYYQYNGTSQSVTNIQPSKDDVFYLVRATPNAGVYSMKNNWSKVELNFSKTITSFFIKPDGNFLLLSTDGLYYRN
ncbi:hypothetical protein IM793_22995 [Pedobacter sp. MR2016-19]|uniref:WD40/YVTN/BNR-like repeat-containing protein n=1 Tax=Pedobacter sp. MR2016-19 TaxID=2780089 RepID=UPI001873A064|nr:hypothetical protein [Pedobacter sp. MR2016-19]MBE5322041.1 hypothetical protein [Pedobacter sp. MR2016-19]